MKRLLCVLLLGVSFAQEPSEIAEELELTAKLVLEKERKILAIRPEELDPLNLTINYLEAARRAIERLDYPVCGRDRDFDCVDVSAVVRDIERILEGLYLARSRIGALRVITPDIEGREKVMRIREYELKLLKEAQEWAEQD